MKTKAPSPTIRITPELKGRVDCNRYDCIEGSKEENIVCALLVTVGSFDVQMTARDFLTAYIWFVQTLYAGIRVDFRLHLQLIGSKLMKDARGMKGVEGLGLLERESIMKTANFISGNSGEFEAALDNAVSAWEAELLISEFFPFSKQVVEA